MPRSSLEIVDGERPSARAEPDHDPAQIEGMVRLMNGGQLGALTREQLVGDAHRAARALTANGLTGLHRERARRRVSRTAGCGRWANA